MSSQFPSNDAQSRFRELLLAISRRPQMYTADGEFLQVVTYIEGFINGAGYPQGQVNLESGMMSFARWLAQRHGVDWERRRWYDTLLSYCAGDQSQATHVLGSLYSEFLDDQT